MNGVGLEFNHLFGFGVLDAGGMVALAKVWKAVPARFHCQGGAITQPRYTIFLAGCYNGVLRSNHLLQAHSKQWFCDAYY